MNLEFHYWIVLFLAKRAGLPYEEALTVAYSSQLVDDRTYPISICGSRGSDELLATQSYSSSDESALRDVRLAFHFVPGSREEASALRLDGAACPLVVTPNGPRAKALLVSALKTRNPYRVGIALHAYADTWAHANFSGTIDSTNAFVIDDPIPPLGHAPALKRPDALNEIWEDPRLLPAHALVNNRVRFTAAARMIYKYLATYARKSFDDVDSVEKELLDLWGRSGEKGRAERFADYAIAAEAPPYERDAWLVAAGLAEAASFEAAGETKMERAFASVIRRGDEWLRSRVSVRSYTVVDEFYKSDLAHWNEAAKAHLAAFAEYH
jgi:hypothetical protein